jgi:hypothetical protein
MEKEILGKIEETVITAALVIGIFFMVLYWR